jgi:hypothetical protein
MITTDALLALYPLTRLGLYDEVANRLAQMLRDAETEGEVIRLRKQCDVHEVMDHPAILDELARLGM